MLSPQSKTAHQSSGYLHFAPFFKEGLPGLSLPSLPGMTGRSCGSRRHRLILLLFNIYIFFSPPFSRLSARLSASPSEAAAYPSGALPGRAASHLKRTRNGGCAGCGAGAGTLRAPLRASAPGDAGTGGGGRPAGAEPRPRVLSPLRAGRGARGSRGVRGWGPRGREQRSGGGSGGGFAGAELKERGTKASNAGSTQSANGYRKVTRPPHPPPSPRGRGGEGG